MLYNHIHTITKTRPAKGSNSKAIQMGHDDTEQKLSVAEVTF